MGFIDKLLGNTSESRVKKLMPQVRRINELEPELHALSDEALRAKTMEFKERLGAGETLDGLLPEAFAVVREAAQRTIGQRHFDVQLLGGIVLHQGRIAEMKTGEGKTITETLPAYLNALTGHGVHIVTVNDYLAKRDAQWMGKIYRFLGLTVGCIVHELDNDARRKAYACDITYGTNNEFGFDYLRDNMVVYKEQMVQRELNYAIVDEVDSILIDEARTPLIISGQGEKSTDLYVKADRFVRRLERGANIEKLSKTEILMGEEQPESGDYMADIKARTVALTQQGLRKAEQFFGIDDISDSENTELNHHILQALKAHALFQRDKDYVVQDGQVLVWLENSKSPLLQVVHAADEVHVHQAGVLHTARSRHPLAVLPGPFDQPAGIHLQLLGNIQHHRLCPAVLLGRDQASENLVVFFPDHVRRHLPADLAHLGANLLFVFSQVYL